MELIDGAWALASQIPEDDDHRDERTFSWFTLGQAALVLGRDDIATDAMERLRETAAGGQLRLAVASSRSALRAGVLADLLDRLGFWEALLWRADISMLVDQAAALFGVSRTARAVAGLADPFTRASSLTTLARLTRDPILKRPLLAEARAAAETVGGDYDYAMGHVIAGYRDAGMIAEAREAIATLRNAGKRLDHLRRLAEAVSQPEERDAIEEERSRLAEENPGVVPQSEILAEAWRLANEDPPGGPPSNRTVAVQIEAMLSAGAHRQAADTILERFPTQALAFVFELGEELRQEVLLAQLDTIGRYHRNDLKVEFLSDLAVNAHIAGEQVSGSVLRAATSPRFLTLEPASAPSISARDPSRMDLASLERFLFDRPVPASEDEERFMRRTTPYDPEVGRPLALMESCAELFRQFARIGPRYSREQVDQALCTILWGAWWPWDVLDRPEVPPALAASFIEASYHPYADYLAVVRPAGGLTSFAMWWDQRWDSMPEGVRDPALKTMVRILALSDRECRRAALCGLNHLQPHPGARAAVEEFLRDHGHELSAEDREYAEACRDGEVR